MASHSSIPIKAAVVYETSGPFVIENVLLDEPRADEILVKMVSCGICHTDLACKGQENIPKPIVFGHEGAGVVDRVGSAVKKVKSGDHVIMSFYSCGSCQNCASGSPSYCSQHGPGNFGAQRADGSNTHQLLDGKELHGAFFRQSSFATYAICIERNCVVVPKDLDLKSLAPLGCGVQTGAGAVLNTFKVHAGSSLVVFGSGGVGLSAIMAARVAGSTAIIAVDINPSRLEIAKELGATHTILATDPELKEKIKEITNGADFALDTTGRPDVLRTAFECLRQKGIAGLIGGSPPGTALSIDMTLLLLGRTVRGIIQGDSVPDVFIPRLIELYRQGRFPYDKLIKYYKFEDINDAARDSCTGATIKPIVIFD